MADTPTQAEVDQYIEDTYGHQKVKMKQADVDKVKQQILSQGLTSKWKGQGFGSAEANALDMAKSLVASGVTDIKQLGQGTYYAPQAVTERLVNASGQLVQQNGGKYYFSTPETYGDGMSGDFLTEVDPKEVTKQFGLTTTESNGDYGSYDVFTPLTADQQKQIKTDATGQRTVPVAQGQGIINKDTGERILSNYNERTQGNAFGGTYAGKGNTAYRVQFDAKGNPIFYTTEASSNDLAKLLSDPVLGAVANIAATYFGGPLGASALQLAQGHDIGDAIKAGVLSYGAGELGNYVTGQVGSALSDVGGIMDNIDVGGGFNPSGGLSSLTPDALSGIAAKTAGNVAKSVVQSGGKINPNSLITSALSGAGNVEIGDTGFNVGDALKGVQTAQALSSGNPLALASVASQYLPSGKISTGPNARDVEPDSFPTISSDKFPTPFTVDQSPLAVASQSDQETPFGGLNAVNQQINDASDTAQNTINDIKPNIQKIIGGIGMARNLQSAAQNGPLGMASAFTNIAKNASSAEPSSRDKLPPARVDVRTLFPVGSNKPPAYVPPSKLTPITSIAGLSKLLSHTG